MVGAFGVGFRVAGDALEGRLAELGVVDDDGRPAVGEGDAGLGLRVDHLRPELLQLKVVVEGHILDELHVLGMEVVYEAGDGGLLRVDAAALLVTALENRYREAGPRQVGGQTEAVVAGSNYDGVVGCRGHDG